MMRLNSVLLFLYAFTAVIFFEDENLVFVPKIFACLLVGEYMIGLLKRSYQQKGTFAFVCLLFLVIHALISYSFLKYDLTIDAIVNILLIFVLSVSIFNLIDNRNAYNAIVLGIVLGISYGFIANVLKPPIDEFGRIGRYDGTLGNPNFFSLVINFAIVFLLKDYHHYPRKIKRLALLFISISAYEIIMSGSKLGLLMYLINVLFLLFYVKPIKSTISIIIITSLVVLTSGFLVSLLFNDNSVSFERLQYLQTIFSNKGDYSDSDLMRYNLATKGFDLWTQKPWFGWGYGAFLYIGGFGLYTHNNLIELLCNTGIAGFLLFHASIAQLIRDSYNSGLRRKQNLLWSIYFSIIVIVGSFGIVLLAEKLYWLLYFTLLASIKLDKAAVYPREMESNNYLEDIYEGSFVHR